MAGCGAQTEGEFSELLKRAKAGDLAAFDQIMIRHERPVFSVALRLLNRPEDAQDAAQEVFLRLYKNLRRFDQAREFSPWLYRMTVNVCRDIGRRRSRHSAPSLEALTGLEEADAGAPDPRAQAVWAQQKRIVREALKGLPEKQRAALVLRDLEGLSTCEVARILGSSQATVRSQVSTARLRIKKYVERFLRGRP